MLLATGRPLLVLPQSFDSDHIGRRVVIAWNASREAARAVADTIPFIERAEQVCVLCINPSDVGDLPGADITTHLARHNATVEATTLSIESHSVGNSIPNAAGDWSSDLVVMGADGNSRLREFVMGGVTRHMLRESQLPLLMSHRRRPKQFANNRRIVPSDCCKVICRAITLHCSFPPEARRWSG